MNTCQIRRAGPEDTDGLTACIGAAYADYLGRIADLPPVTEGIGDDIARHRVFVAERGHLILGGLVLVEHHGALHLANIAVHPDAQGQGLGGALMAQADRVAQALGYGEMRLATHVEMPGNMALYSHLGWCETGRTGNKVEMAKSVSGGGAPTRTKK